MNHVAEPMGSMVQTMRNYTGEKTRLQLSRITLRTALSQSM